MFLSYNIHRDFNFKYLQDKDAQLMELLSNIKPKKQSAFYRYFHPYFTKLPPNIVEHYVKAFSKPGEIVADPFCGSGVVGIESLLLGRKTFCSDLSPLAYFISKELMNSDVDTTKLAIEFETIKANSYDLIQKVWSYGDEGLYTRKNKFFTQLLNEFWYPEGDLTYRSNFEKITDLYDVRQLITYAILFDGINEIKDLGVRNTLIIAFFGAMSRANLSYMVSGSRHGSVLHNGGSSLFSIYDYRKPKEVVVVPVWERFERRYIDLLRIKQKTNKSLSSIPKEIYAQSNVLKYDVLKLDNILESESIDYIFTDPPYGSKIPYLELATMWSMWMGWGISEKDKKSEIIEGGELKKSKDSYVDLMGKSIEMMSYLLKDGRHMSMVYQHNDINVWKDLLESAHEAGFVYKSSVIQSTSSSTVIKKKFKGDIISAPLIINFKKEKKKIRGKKSITNNQIRTLFKKIIPQIDLASDEDIYNEITKVLFDYLLFSSMEEIEQIFNNTCIELGYDVEFSFSKHSLKK